jgi:exopolyphosphatase/guanosine-5'-triphosphate,3'-diphosphate pyrophosphatase
MPATWRHVGRASHIVSDGAPTSAEDQRVAVIDVGTNSVNMLIRDHDGDILRRFATPRLGEGLARTRLLSSDAQTRAVSVLQDYMKDITDAGVDRVRIIGTSACRRATNIDQFAALVRTATNVDLEVADEHTEAKLSFRGALTGLSVNNTHGTERPIIVVDIGGGSTEFTIGVREPDVTFSLPYGAVVTTETELGHDPPRPEELTNAIGAVEDDLEELTRAHPALVADPLVVGVAGTIVTVAAVEIGLTTFDDAALHGFVLSKQAAEDVFRTLATERLEDRIFNPGLPRERADIIVGGCCVLVGIMRRLRLDSLVVSTRNLLDGAAAQMLELR